MCGILAYFFIFCMIESIVLASVYVCVSRINTTYRLAFHYFDITLELIVFTMKFLLFVGDNYIHAWEFCANLILVSQGGSENWALKYLGKSLDGILS